MSDSTLDPPTQTRLIQQIADHLEQLYVFPQKGAELAQQLRSTLEHGEYAALTDVSVLCNTLTEHLQAWSKDKHVRLVAYAQPQPPQNDDQAWQEAYWAAERLNNYGVYAVQRLKGNIGYIDLRSIDDADHTADTLNAAMTLVAHTHALIIDLRYNNGGSPSGVALLASYLLGPHAVHVDSIYDRPDDHTTEFWTRIKLPGPRYLANPVFILTSAKTFSGAEEFAYTLQAYQRATIVGEITAGAANPMQVQQLHPQIDLCVPTGRPIHPVTQTNWEGVGVRPDVVTAFDQAFPKAYAQALDHVILTTQDNTAAAKLRLEAEQARKELL